jgi:hypothetical protein
MDGGGGGGARGTDDGGACMSVVAWRGIMTV